VVFLKIFERFTKRNSTQVSENLRKAYRSVSLSLSDRRFGVRKRSEVSGRFLD
jgi:hypothetical protein